MKPLKLEVSFPKSPVRIDFELDYDTAKDFRIALGRFESVVLPPGQRELFRELARQLMNLGV
jgi:hypothetical protein